MLISFFALFGNLNSYDLTLDISIIFCFLILVMLSPIIWLIIKAHYVKQILRNCLEIEAKIERYYKVDSRRQYDLGIGVVFSYTIFDKMYQRHYEINKNEYTKNYYDNYKKEGEMVKILVKNDGKFQKILIKVVFV